MANKTNNSRPKAKAHTTKPTNVTGSFCVCFWFLLYFFHM